jgi:hypothetical protein
VNQQGSHGKGRGGKKGKEKEQEKMEGAVMLFV